MNFRNFLFSMLVIFFCVVMGNAMASDCSGNACDDVTVDWDGTCYTYKNHGTKRIKVRVGQNTSFELQRGGSQKFVWIDGKCTNTMPAKFTANYVNP